MPDPSLPPGQLRTFDKFVAQLQPDTYPNLLSITQSVEAGGAVIASVATSAVSLQVVDPAAGPLAAAEIVAVYPPSGSEDATDVMLPHIVLRARSLPWACAPVAQSGTFLALLLLLDGEASFDATSVTAPLAHLRKIFPKKPELDLLCHVRELPADDPLAARDDDRFVALVLGNRIPQADRTCHACLVDLRDASPALWDATPPTNNPIKLKLLHRWTFKTAAGGDFEAHWARLRKPGPQNPTGGVQAFGQTTAGEPLGDDDGALELAAPLPDEPDRRVRYHGPLAPLARDLVHAPVDQAKAALAVDESGVEVVGHAAAFELGRMLALSNPRVLDSLLGFRQHQLERDLEVVQNTPLPGSPRPIDFRGDNWRDIFKNTHDWFDDVKTDLWRRTGDPTGILALVGKIPGLGADRLADLGGLQLTQRLATMQNPAAFPAGPDLPISAPSLGSITLDDPNLADVLRAKFSGLPAAVAAVGLHLDEEMP